MRTYSFISFELFITTIIVQQPLEERVITGCSSKEISVAIFPNSSTGDAKKKLDFFKIRCIAGLSASNP